MGFIGLTDIHIKVVEPTLARGPEVGPEKRREAISEAKEMAKMF